MIWYLVITIVAAMVETMVWPVQAVAMWLMAVVFRVRRDELIWLAVAGGILVEGMKPEAGGRLGLGLWLWGLLALSIGYQKWVGEPRASVGMLLAAVSSFGWRYWEKSLSWQAVVVDLGVWLVAWYALGYVQARKEGEEIRLR